jgi:hypothetical protein
MRNLIQESKSVVGLFDRFANTIKRNTGANRFLEKSPRHALRMRYITDHFPKSTIVFVVRDPRDGVRSAREHPVIWSTFPDNNRLEGYLRVWKKSVEAYLSHVDYGRVLMIRYEDLCREPHETIRALSQSIGIGMEEQQLHPETYGDTKASISTTHTRLQEQITPKSVGAWREKLSKADARHVERTLAEEMQVLDYSPEVADVA